MTLEQPSTPLKPSVLQAALESKATSRAASRSGLAFATEKGREQTLGRHLRYPRLAVLIGRASSEERQERLSFAQRNVDVQIIPYDELLEIQRGLYDIEASGRG